MNNQQKNQCPNFISWLNSRVNNDQDQVQIIRAWMNALINERQDLQKILHIAGPAYTGKSTFERIIFMIIGSENCVVSNFSVLGYNRFEEARYRNKKLILLSINDPLKHLNAKRLVNERSLISFIGREERIAYIMHSKNTESFVYEGQILSTGIELNKNLFQKRLITVFFNEKINYKEIFSWRQLVDERDGMIRWAMELPSNDVTLLSKTMHRSKIRPS